MAAEGWQVLLQHASELQMTPLLHGITPAERAGLGEPLVPHTCLT